MTTKNIAKLSLFSLTLCSLLLATQLWGQLHGDLLFKAMQDELDRSMSQLVMEDMERPYSISYTIDDIQQLNVRGSLGTLTASNMERQRVLTVDVRVGDYSLDNSNFVAGFSGFGSDYSTIALDNDYDALRNQIYLETDAAYKGALESVAKKRAYLQTRVLPNRPDDFIKLPANRHLDKPQEFDIQRTKFEELARTASTVFRDYPAIMSAKLGITADIINQYYVNSAGSRALRGNRIYGFELSMMGKAGDGQDIFNSDRMVVTNPEAIPSSADLTAWAKANAEKMNRLIQADTLEEYIGPVIFTGDAAGEFFRQLFAKNVSNIPAPLFENDQMAQMMGSGGDFGDKLNRRVLPASFTVYDDPTITKVGDQPMIGGYTVDDAGNTPQRVTLVENGKLVNLLVGIAPTKKIKDANGHARGAVGTDVTAKPSNLIFESSEKVPYDKLKQTLIGLCKDVDLPYGLIVKRLQEYGSSSRGMMFQFFGQRPGVSEVLTPPWEVHKVYADGREEPVRGLQFNNVTVRILKDVLQTDDRMHVYNYLIGNDYEIPVSIVAPSVLVEEMELKKSEEKIKKPPLLPSPLAEK